MLCSRLKKLCYGVALVLTGWIGLAVPPAHAATLEFSQLSSDATPASALDATVNFSVVSGKLNVDIFNDSAYKIAQLYFNSNMGLTGLMFNALGDTNPAWTISGSGASQSQNANGFGNYNWLIDFGSGSNRLAAGSETNLILDYTGSVDLDAICNNLSSIPPGHNRAVAALKFEAGPEGDSAFGTGVGGPTAVVPEPGTALMLLSGALPMLGVLRRRRNQ